MRAAVFLYFLYCSGKRWKILQICGIIIFMREESIQDILSAEELGEKYDKAAKAVWRNREILAPLLRFCVGELKNESVESIMHLIDADSICEDTPVSDLPPMVIERATEMNSTIEKPITFDFRLLVKNPKLSTKTMLVQLHIILEFQNKFRPVLKDGQRYYVEERGWYYDARELSSQLGRLTENTNYHDLEKVISIWIVSEDVPNELQNTVSRYYIEKEDLVGKADIAKEIYDLMEVVIVRRGKNGHFDAPVFDYLNAVFASDIESIDKYTPASKNPELVKEVRKMPGMGQAILERGINIGEERGITIGEKRGITIGEKRGITIGEKRGITIGEKRGITIGEKRGITIGEKRGINIGEKNTAKLMSILAEKGRTDDIIRAANDDSYLNKLFVEFDIRPVQDEERT